MADRKKQFPGWLQVAAFVAAAISVIATQPPRQPRNYPTWEFTNERTRDLFGLDAKLWVSKSGKRGTGITLRLHNPDSVPVIISLLSAQFTAGEITRTAQGVPTEVSVKPHTSHHLYIPFTFDNEKTWNDSFRKGILSLRFKKEGKEIAWRADLKHHLRGFHRTVPPECIYWADERSEEAEPIQKTYDESSPCKEKEEKQ